MKSDKSQKSPVIEWRDLANQCQILPERCPVYWLKFENLEKKTEHEIR